MKPRIQPPLCQFCGKPLARYRYRREAYLADARRAEAKLAESGDSGYWKENARYAHQRADEVNPAEQWGGEGDNVFCKQQCGYRWAINQLAAQGVKVPFTWTVKGQSN